MPDRRDFEQLTWDAAVQEDCRQLVRLGVREDLDRTFDWTTVSLVPAGHPGKAYVVARRPGVIAGLMAAAMVVEEMDQDVQWTPHAADGAAVTAGQHVATLAGPARSLLTMERLILNFVGHLSGVATLTRQYVDLVAGTQAHIYDTRKTTPGWRRLEKYAVHCGGGRNHRTGLFDAILIKDNHLAIGAQAVGVERYTPAEAVCKVRAFLAGLPPADPHSGMIVEVEVESVAQFADVLAAGPDIVLLDNMTNEDRRRCVELRDDLALQVSLEASGGVNLQTVRGIAESGVDRISVGALTHSAAWFDVALDWAV